jgi:hypothetical protein
MKNELEFEWRSARRWKKLLKPTEDIHLEHVTLDDLHQSTRGFRNAHERSVLICILKFFFKSESIQNMIYVPNDRYLQKSSY